MLKPHELSALFLNSSFPSTAPDTLQFLYISFFLWHLVHHDVTMVHFHIRSFRSSLFITATNCANSTTKEGGLLKSTCTTGHCLLIYIYRKLTSMHVGLTVPSMHSVGQLDIKPLNCNSRFCQLITEFVF